MENKENYTTEEIIGFANSYADVVYASTIFNETDNNFVLKHRIQFLEKILTDFENNVPENVRCGLDRITNIKAMLKNRKELHLYLAQQEH